MIDDIELPPPSTRRPVLDSETVAGYLERGGVDLSKELFIVLGIRGARGKANTIGTFDDILAVVTADAIEAFDANTDPSAEKPGEANLICGYWRYKAGIHHIGKPTAYPAFVQDGPVTVSRWKQGSDTGWFGINIHRGGENTTGSEGCQTIIKHEWDEFHDLVLAKLAATGKRGFSYLLVDAA